MAFLNERRFSLRDVVETRRFPQVLPMLGLNRYWYEVFHHQTTEVHWLTSFLYLRISGKTIEPEMQIEITAFLRYHIKPGTDVEWAQVIQ